MVLEFREDPSKGSLVVVASDRAKRPELFGTVACPFCKGAESTTPPTTFALPSDAEWKVRTFRNLFAVLKPEGTFVPKAEGENFWRSYAFGDHEIVVETDVHGKLLQDFSQEELSFVFKAYQNRFIALSKQKDAKCVFLFKNHGRLAGASIEHEHAQIIALPFVPPVVEKEIALAGNYLKNHGTCLYCDLLQREQENILFENEFFTALCPSFSRFPFEIWIVSKKHEISLAEFDDAEGAKFMALFQQCVQSLFNVVKDYNVVFHGAPKAGASAGTYADAKAGAGSSAEGQGNGLHFHVEIYPRSNVWAGIELGTGLIVNTKSEKDALSALRKTQDYRTTK